MPAGSDDRSFFMGPGVDDNLFCELPQSGLYLLFKQNYTSDPAPTFILPDTWHHKHSLNISDKASFTSSSCCCTALSMLSITFLQPSGTAPQHAWASETQLLEKSQLSTPGWCHHNQADEPRFVFLSWKPPPPPRKPLSRWEKKGALRGERLLSTSAEE